MGSNGKREARVLGALILSKNLSASKGLVRQTAVGGHPSDVVVMPISADREPTDTAYRRSDVAREGLLLPERDCGDDWRTPHLEDFS
jgi:hypothetical protein